MPNAQKALTYIAKEKKSYNNCRTKDAGSLDHPSMIMDGVQLIVLPLKMLSEVFKN